MTSLYLNDTYFDKNSPWELNTGLQSDYKQISPLQHEEPGYKLLKGYKQLDN